MGCSFWDGGFQERLPAGWVHPASCRQRPASEGAVPAVQPGMKELPSSTQSPERSPSLGPAVHSSGCQPHPRSHLSSGSCKPTPTCHLTGCSSKSRCDRVAVCPPQRKQERDGVSHSPGEAARVPQSPCTSTHSAHACVPHTLARPRAHACTHTHYAPPQPLLSLWPRRHRAPLPGKGASRPGVGCGDACPPAL